jgi:hypothetical protein
MTQATGKPQSRAEIITEFVKHSPSSAMADSWSAHDPAGPLRGQLVAKGLVTYKLG